MAKLNPSKRTMAYASAGHVPGILMNRSGEEKARFLSLGPPLGIFQDQEFTHSGTVPSWKLRASGVVVASDLIMSPTMAVTARQNTPDACQGARSGQRGKPVAR